MLCVALSNNGALPSHIEPDDVDLDLYSRAEGSLSKVSYSV